MPGDPRYYPNTNLPSPNSPIGGALKGGADFIRGLDPEVLGRRAAEWTKDQLHEGMIDPDSIDTTMPPLPRPPTGRLFSQSGGGQLPSQQSINVPIAPSGQVNTKPMYGEYGSGKDVGTASYNGPKLNTEAALSGLKNSNSTANFSDAPSGPSNEELYRHAFGDPSSMAPGAPQMAQGQLKGRMADEDWNTLLQQKQQEAILGGLTSLHPAIQASEEQKAQRISYPAQYNAQADNERARLDYNAKLQAAELGVEGDAVTSNKYVMAEAMKNLGTAKDPANLRLFGTQERADSVARYWESILDGLRGAGGQ